MHSFPRGLQPGEKERKKRIYFWQIKVEPAASGKIRDVTSSDHSGSRCPCPCSPSSPLGERAGTAGDRNPEVSSSRQGFGSDPPRRTCLHPRGTRKLQHVLQSPAPGADSLTPSALSPANQGTGRGEATGQSRLAAVREPANGVEALERIRTLTPRSKFRAGERGSKFKSTPPCVGALREGAGPARRGRGLAGVSAAARWECGEERRALHFRVRSSPAGPGFLFSMASGSGAGAAASANLNAVRETMDGEYASRSLYPARASRAETPMEAWWRVRRSPRRPPAPSCEGLGKGDPQPPPRSWRPGVWSAGPPRWRSLALARRSGLAAARYAPSPGPRDPPRDAGEAGD